MNREAFVVMPFSATPSCENWDIVYEHVFKVALENAGWLCQRAEVETGNLIVGIVDNLRTAPVVLADITDRNANVFYELGVRHALSNRTVLVSQHSDHIPSDLRGYWHIIYGLGPAEVSKFKDNLKRVLTKLESAPEHSDNPVSDYLMRSNQSVSRLVNIDNLKKLNALHTELSGNIHEVASNLEQPTSAILLNTGCLSRLLETYYVDLGADALAAAYELRVRLLMLSKGGQEPSLITESLHLAGELLAKVDTAREQIARGSFSEPSTPSLMKWSASDAQCAQCGQSMSSTARFCPGCGWAAPKQNMNACVNALVRPRNQPLAPRAEPKVGI